MSRATHLLGVSAKWMWALEGQMCKDAAEFQGCAPVLETSIKLSEASPKSPVPILENRFCFCPCFFRRGGGEFLLSHFLVPSSEIADVSLCFSGWF